MKKKLMAFVMTVMMSLGLCSSALAAPMRSLSTSITLALTNTPASARFITGTNSGLHPLPKKCISSMLSPSICGSSSPVSTRIISRSVEWMGLMPWVCTLTIPCLLSLQHQSVLVLPLSAISIIIDCKYTCFLPKRIHITEKISNFAHEKILLQHKG